MSQSISKKKWAEKELQASESRYKMLTEFAPVGIFRTDLNGITNYVNPFWCEISKMSSNEALGLGWLRIIHPDDRDKVSETWQKAILTRTTSEGEYRFLHSDGSVTWINGTAVPAKDENGIVVGYLGTITNITKRKKAESALIQAKEKAEESDRLKTAFLHNISHEIRTPLNAIIGFSSLLGEHDMDNKNQKSYIEIINQSSNQLLGIVSDLIEISKIEAGISKVNCKKTNVNILLSELYNHFKPEADKNIILLSVETDLQGSEAEIETDNTKLVQILTNLLINALKFTFQGEIKFGYKHTGDNLEFFVSDSGIGIPEDQFMRIFDRFYQVEHSSSRIFEGTGLGLAISKAYVELLGGRIWLTSKLDKGTCFYFTLPYINNHVAPIPEILPVTLKKNQDRRSTVLIAEDEENNFSLMSALLSELNLNILHAHNGKEAVEICKLKHDIAVVLMDIKMPVMDGYSATKEIHRFLPLLPIIATTAFAFESDKEKAVLAGCNDYISKPVNRELLIAMVRKFI